MSRLTRYTTREVALPAAAALVVTTFLLFTTQILRVGEAAFGRGLTGGDFVLILALMIPRFLVFTLPIAALVGVVAGLGRLSDDREVVALESAGLSPLYLARGPVLLGLVASGATLLLTTWAEPRALATLADRLATVVERNLAEGLTPGVIHEEIPGVVLQARGRDESGVLTDVFVRLERDGEEATVVARTARLLPTGTGGLALEVSDGELVETGETSETGVPTLSRVRFERGTVALDVKHTVKRRVRFIGDVDTLTSWDLATAARAEPDPEARRKLEAVWHRRLSSAGAGAVLALFAIPLGLHPTGERRRRRLLGLLGGLGGVGGYYLLLRLGEAAALAGHLPASVALWLPNVGIGLLAMVLIARRARR